jgi:DNA-3-methyladenine glycosylase II|nr:DNA-3-methyladenine glycosylase 2 family protein [uncultured Undibacterium sp.]
MNKNSHVRSNVELHVPEYWESAKIELMKRDRILRKLIPQFGDLYLLGRDDPFTTLTRSIIAQQISGASANVLWEKYLTVCPKSNPAEVISAGKERLLDAGLSKRKTDYILDLAGHFKDGRVHVDNWVDMSDEAVISELIQIRGISRWTAEMFLIFNLLRPNILPLDDAGLVSGISKNYFSCEPVSRIDIREVAANWEPWRTVATWYMWRSLDEKNSLT